MVDASASIFNLKLDLEAGSPQVGIVDNSVTVEPITGTGFQVGRTCAVEVCEFGVDFGRLFWQKGLKWFPEIAKWFSITRH